MMAKFTIDLLVNISSCIKAIMSINTGLIRGNSDSSTTTMVKLRLSLLSNRNRSELLHSMIVIADNITELYQQRDYQDEVVLDWNTIRDSFMNMLDP